MPRPRKSARLWLRPGRDDRAAVWVILDGGKEFGTGCSQGDVAGAEQALADYVAKKHDPKKAIRQGDPNSTKVADAISVYWTEHAQKPSRPEAIRKRLDTLLDFFGLKVVGELNGSLQRDYAEKRGSLSAARRELEDLAAAINHTLRDKVGGGNIVFRPVLPDAAEARDRWLTRKETAHLIWTAWRARKRNRGGTPGPHMSKHLARFILVALYTGTRAGAVCGAALVPSIERGYVDLERGVFHRKAVGARTTNKRQPTVDIMPRLLAHMRRWHRLGISKHSVIEWQGEPVLRVSKTFETIREAAKLPDVPTRCGTHPFRGIFGQASRSAMCRTIAVSLKQSSGGTTSTICPAPMTGYSRQRHGSERLARLRRPDRASQQRARKNRSRSQGGLFVGRR
jgi:integrase